GSTMRRGSLVLARPNAPAGREDSEGAERSMTDYFCRKLKWHRRWSNESMTYRTGSENGVTTTISESQRTCAICGMTITKKSERKDSVTVTHRQEETEQ